MGDILLLKEILEARKTVRSVGQYCAQYCRQYCLV